MSNSPSSQPRKNKRRPLAPTSRMIKQLRKASGYTQEEIRSVLGFRAASAVSRLESGDFKPDIHRLDKFLNLLKPNEEQKQEILKFFGYKTEDLKDTEINIRVVRHHEEQHPFLVPFQNLFYLFVYQKDYVNVLEQCRQYQQKMPDMPAVLLPVEPELQLLTNELLDSRRLMAQGGLEKRLLDYEEAGRRAKSALTIFELLIKRSQGQISVEPALALLLQLKLHAQLCLHSSLFKQLNVCYRETDKQASAQQLSHQLRHEVMPEVRETLQALKKVLHDEELHELYRMYLFIEREYLHLLMRFTDTQEQGLFAQFDDVTLLALNIKKSTKAKTTRAQHLLMDLYPKVYGSTSQMAPLWKNVSEHYDRVLREHQRLPNWDGESPEVMRAILKTFLGYSHALARQQHHDKAELFLDTLYLRLNVKESHYHWHSNYAVVQAYRYIDLCRLEAPKAKQKVELEAILMRFAEHLSQAIGYVHRGALDLEIEITRDDILRYTYLQEPAFCLLWAHCALYNVQPESESFKQLIKDREEWLAKQQ